MTLLDLLKAKSEDEQKAFAIACGTSVQYLFQIARGHKKAGETLAINIERETARAITCEDLRPDVDWAFIRNTKPRKRKAA